MSPRHSHADISRPPAPSAHRRTDHEAAPGRAAGRQRPCADSAVDCSPLSRAHPSSLRAADLHHALVRDSRLAGPARGYRGIGRRRRVTRALSPCAVLQCRPASIVAHQQYRLRTARLYREPRAWTDRLLPDGSASPRAGWRRRASPTKACQRHHPAGTRPRESGRASLPQPTKTPTGFPGRALLPVGVPRCAQP